MIILTEAERDPPQDWKWWKDEAYKAQAENAALRASLALATVLAEQRTALIEELLQRLPMAEQKDAV